MFSFFVLPVGPTSWLVEHLAHRRQQSPDADGLAVEAIEPRGHDSRAVLGHHRGRDRDDRDGARHRISPKLLQGVDAVDARQLDVHQDERWSSLVCEAHTLFTGLGLDGLVSRDLQRIPDELHVFGVVFDNEDELMRHDVPGW